VQDQRVARVQLHRWTECRPFLCGCFSTCARCARVHTDTDACICEGGSSLSLTSLASVASLADLNCTRRGGGRNGLSRVPLLKSERERESVCVCVCVGESVKRKNKRHTRRREQEGECLEGRERVHRCEKIRPLALKRVNLPGNWESWAVRKAFNYHAR